MHEKIGGVYLDFVEDGFNVDNDKSYIVYSLQSSNPKYEFEYSRDIYQVSVYSASLEHALSLQKKIGKFFNSLKKKIDNIEICGCDISNESHNRIENAYQTITIIEILYKY
ncbi:hypothetical protein [Brachyspira hyodysenteriae]|uniref:hypothetical protein n=1 Tax=Brachyspira hyodysenteriae TaxID=159 RepID=UPI0022CE162A|nr:hypothetical protein [Brachyspira hyodysenteriae]MDA0085857.1 hypothetical protein [Brachyspira hyodysenteriae]